MEWAGRRVLVTGGAGFLGANLCHALAARGAKVTALDGFLFGGGANPANLDGADVTLVNADIREVDLRNLCEGRDVIFNLAAQTSHMGGQRDPLADIAVNAVAQVRLIQAAREAAEYILHVPERFFNYVRLGSFNSGLNIMTYNFTNSEGKELKGHYLSITSPSQAPRIQPEGYFDDEPDE